MGNLIEEISLRDRKYVFKDRNEAGRLLSKKLLEHKGSDSIILAIPSGGVPIAFEIKQTLRFPIDLNKNQIQMDTAYSENSMADFDTQWKKEERRKRMATDGIDCLGFRHSLWCYNICFLWREWVLLGDK